MTKRRMDKDVLHVETVARLGGILFDQNATVRARVKNAGVADDHRGGGQFRFAIHLVELLFPLIKMAQLQKVNSTSSLSVALMH